MLGILLACAPAMYLVLTCSALPVLPKIVDAFPEQPAISGLVSLVVVLPTFAIVLSSFIAGVVGESLGRRRLLVASTFVFAACAPAPIWIQSFSLLLVSRAIGGLAVGFMTTSAVALLGDFFAGTALQRWLGAQAAVGALCAIVVSVASGALGSVSWHLAFIPGFAGALLLAGLLVVRSPERNAGPVTGSASANTATDLSEPDTPGLQRIRLGVLCLAAIGNFIINPPAYEMGAVLQEKALGSAFLTGAAVAVLAMGAAAAAVGLPLLGRLSFAAKLSLAMASAALGTFVIAIAHARWVVLCGSAIVGASQGLLGPVLSMTLLDATPARLRGRLVGVLQTVTFLAIFAAPVAARSAALLLGRPSMGLSIWGFADLLVLVGLVVTGSTGGGRNSWEKPPIVVDQRPVRQE